MLKHNFKEYNNKWQRKNINPVISFSKNPWMDKNYIDRFLFSCLLKTSNKIKTFNIYQSRPCSLSKAFSLTAAGLDKNNKKSDSSDSNKINKLNINSLSIFAYNNFLKNKQNIYKENEFLNKTPYLKTKIASKWNNNLIRWFPHIENKAYQGIKLNNLTTLKGYLNLNFENFSSKGRGNKNSYITGNNPFKNKIIIDIGAHITTITYKKVIFEQRELFQIRKIYNEYSGKNTHIFNFLKTFCKYIFSPNELNDNILFKSYLNRLNGKYLNKLVNENNGVASFVKLTKQTQNIIENNETLLDKKKETEKIKYLLNVLTQSKKIKLINILKKKEIENNLTNVVATKHISLFQNDLNETNNNNLKIVDYTNWGKINNYTYTNVIKQLNTNNQNTLNINEINNVKKNNKEINNITNWYLQNQQEENQLKLFKYLHNIFFKTPNISKSDVNIHLNDNNINTNILIKSLLGQYLDNIEFANVSGSKNDSQNNELKNINYLTIEEINAYSTYKTNWISSLILNKLVEILKIAEIEKQPWLEKQNNSKKETLTNILNNNIKNTNINYDNTLKESQNIAHVANSADIEKILLLPFFYEKNPTEIKENLEKINNINFFNFEGQNQDNFLITNEIYPWNITNNKENFAENTNKEIDIKRDSNLAIENEYLINNENNNKTIYQNNLKDRSETNNVTPYISINSLLLILNRLIHKKSIEFIFTTKHMYASIFYLKYYWLYLYNHFYPDSFKMDWNIPLNQKNNKFITPNLSNEDTINFEENITKNTLNNFKKTESILQTNLILGKNKKILSTHLHVQFLKSRYYLKMINTNYFQKNIKYKNKLNESHSKFNIESNNLVNRGNPISENNTNVIKQNENWEKENNEEFNFLNTLNDSTHLEKQKETYLNWNKGNYTKKLIALLMYKKKQSGRKGTNKSANNFNFNNISLNNSNQGFLININRNKLTILQTDVSVYNSLNLIDLCF